MYTFNRIGRYPDNRRWFIHFTFENSKNVTKDAYLSTDGSILECSRYNGDVPSEIWYATQALAQKALDKFKNKGKQMTTSKLTTGMIVVQKNGDTMMVLKGTANGDILSGQNAWRPLEDTQFAPAITYLDKYSIVAVYQPKNNKSYSLHTFATNRDKQNDYDVVWEYKKEPTTMTIAEIQKKLGIDNLHIVD